MLCCIAVPCLLIQAEQSPQKHSGRLCIKGHAVCSVGAIDVQELRAQRLARTRARMQEQLVLKQERDAREAAQHAQKGDLRTAIRPRIEAWQAGKKV